MHGPNCKTVFSVDFPAATLAVYSLKTTDYAALYRTKEKTSQLITKGWEMVFQWIPSRREIPGIDMVDAISKDASNLTSREEPTTYQQAIRAFTRNSTLLVLDIYQQ
jgi:hypothetical protein